MTETFEAKLLPTSIKLIPLHGLLLLTYLLRSVAVQDVKTTQGINTLIKEEKGNICQRRKYKATDFARESNMQDRANICSKFCLWF
jgi:hypothetical protein